MPGSYVNTSGRKSSQGCIQPQLSFLQNWENWALLVHILRILLWSNTPPTVHRKCISEFPLEQNRGFGWFKTSRTSNLQKPLDTLKDGDNTKGITWMENWAPNANSGAKRMISRPEWEVPSEDRKSLAVWGKRVLSELCTIVPWTYAPWAALPSTWSSLLAVFSSASYSPSLLHFGLAIAQFTDLQA